MPSSEPSSLAVLLIDADGLITAATPAAAGLLGGGQSDLVGSELVVHLRHDFTVSDLEGRRLQWEVLVEAAAARGVRVTPAAGGAELQLRLEVGLPTAAWICTLARVPANTAEGIVFVAPPLADACERLCLRAPFGFFDLRCDTGVLITSVGWKRMLGYAEDEWPDDPGAWRGLVHPDDTAALPDRISRRQAAGGRSFAVEYRVRHRDGRYLWTSCVGLREFTADGALLRICGLQTDISERKELEELGLVDEERMRCLGEECGLAAFDFDFGEGRHWFSAGLMRLLGRPGGEAATMDSADAWFAALSESERERGVEALFGADACGRPIGRRQIKLGDGKGGETTAWMWYHREQDTRGGLSRVIGYLVTGAPLDDDMVAGPAVSALAEVAEGVLVADALGRVVFTNAKAVRLLGRSEGELVGLPLEQAFPLVNRVDGRPAPEALEMALDQAGSSAGSRNHDAYGVTRRQPVPGVVPVVWSVRERRDEVGERAGFIVVFRDPDELTLTPDELVRANRFESLGLLAGGIAHDFNNLLTTILGAVSTARENREFNQLQTAEEACMAAKQLTRQLLAFAKGGGKQAARQVVAPADLLQNSVRIAASGSPVVVRVQASDGLHPVEVDKAQIMQVVQNLIINAIQAVPDPAAGRVEVRAMNVELAEGEVDPLPAGEYVRVDVEDNGTGIPPEVLPRIFEPFFSTKKTGTGLGLATADSIVRRHGGRIGVRSERGAGTVFGFYLPVASKPVAAVARRPPSIRFGTGRVLLMDDDPKICELTGGMLASLDCTHDIARTGEEALQLYRRYLNIGRPYDVVLLDITVIGGMGGEECLRHLRGIDPDVRAVVSSGYDEDGLIRHYLDQGFAACLTKPYRVGDLARVLKAVLGR